MFIVQSVHCRGGAIMGLFDKLFKRNKPTTPSKPSQSQEPPKCLDAASLFSPSDIANKIETAIAKNPYAAEFRLAQQQTNVSMKSMDYLTFYQKANGRFVTLDFETTGLDCVKHEIVEIGAARVVNGQITETYHQYVNPNQPISPAATAVNHITDDMVSDKPFIYEVLPNLLHFIGSDIVVAHNAAFDFRFLAQTCMRRRFRIPMNWFDSLDIEVAWPELPNRKLETFLSAAGIKNNEAHSAIGDAEALAQLMIVTMKKRFNMPLPPDFEFGFSNDHFVGTVEKVDNVLSGKRFVITGEVEGHDRYALEQMINAHGGKCSLKISNATDFLVVGQFKNLPAFYMSAKEVYAEKLISEGGKIKIITPSQLFEMMGEAL